MTPSYVVLTLFDLGMSIQLLATLAGHTDRGELCCALYSAHYTAANALPLTHSAWHLSWSPSSPLLASCSSDKSIRFYHFTPSGQFTPTTSIPSAHQRTIRSLSFSPTGQTLSTASFDATVGIWQKGTEAGIEDGMAGGGEEAEWEAVDPLEGHESECKSVEWSHDGRLVASCSRDKSVWVWEGQYSIPSPREIRRRADPLLSRGGQQRWGQQSLNALQC